MHISFAPQRRDDALEVFKAGDVLTINGEEYNLAVIPDGATLHTSQWLPDGPFVGTIERIDGDLHVTLILPHGPSPSEAVAFPQPITVTEDGPIALPEDSHVDA